MNSLRLTAQDFPQAVIFQGIEVVCDVQHLDTDKKKGTFEEGDDVLFQFKISDTLTGEGLSGAYPAAWLGINPPGKPSSCNKKIESFLTSNIFNRAELDMNVYYVMTMNEDASLTVVDPLFGYGGTKMLATVLLKSPAMDWVITADQNTVFVSQPAAKEVAIVQTSTWEVVKNIPIPGPPVHTQLQPNEAYLWVTYVSEDENAKTETGVAIINTATRELETTILTGVGWHEIDFSDDNRFAFVTNGEDNSLAVIDIPSLKKIKTIPVGKNPTAVAWSALAKVALVGHKETGAITVINGQQHTEVTTIMAEPGIEQIAFAPGERLAFVVNPLEDIVHIIDIANNQIVQTADVDDQPDQVNFSDDLAYIRHRGSEAILMIPLAIAGIPNTPVQVIDFPGGQNPAGATSLPSAAPGIVQAPGSAAVLVANGLDQAVYFYMEGMAAPMGNFSNYGKEPRAVMVIDRSLQEAEKGVYQTAVKLRDPGSYDIAFFMNAPRLTHCFPLEIGASEAVMLEKEIARLGNVKVEYLAHNETLVKSQHSKVQFRLVDRSTKTLLTDLADVHVLQMKTSAIWYQNTMAQPTDMPGVYEVGIEHLQEGSYNFFVECPSKGFSANQSPPEYFEVITEEPIKTNED